MKVAINAGHCPGLDSGCVGSKITEVELTKPYAEKVQAYLEAAGIETLFIQDNELQNICDQANEFGADIFVSIHFNAFNKRASGTETCISGTTASLLLGHSIQSNIVAALKLPNRGLKEHAEFFVLRSTAMPAVLLEICFIDNNHDWRRYVRCQDDVARAIATGIMQYPGIANTQQLAA